MIYSVMAWLATRTPIRPSQRASGALPRVTVLKPLCGAEPETYDCLRSFCEQDYPDFQVVFGVSDSDDPALGIVQRLRMEFPHLDLQVAIDRRQHGSNRKVSNLLNMMPLARHDYLVLSDCDVRVSRDYLAKVVAPLLDHGVGIVTCPYRGVARPGLWSLLGSMYINEWFMPSVRVAAVGGSRSFAFGATIAIRRHVLTNLGGFASLANQLADDYRLGELTRRMGLRTVLSEVEVETYVRERSVEDLVRHELRWLRTIRAIQPSGYGFSFVTFGIPVTVLQALLVRGASTAVGFLAVTALARVMLHLSVRRKGTNALLIFLLPLRDFLSFALWGWSFTTRRVQWREERYHITRDGSAQPVVRSGAVAQTTGLTPGS